MRKFVFVFVLVFGLVSAGFGQVFVGEWLYFEDQDLITDENSSFIVSIATDYPQFADDAGFAIRCAEWAPLGVEVFFLADRYLGSDDTRPVTYRFDSDEAVVEVWGSSTDGKGVFLPSFSVASFLSRANTAERIVVRVESYSSTYTYVVPLVGLNDALYRLGCYQGTL